MPKNKIYSLIEKLRSRVNTNEMLSKFIINYYLSRKLKVMSITEIEEIYSDEVISSFLTEVYEDPDNIIKEFTDIEDISLVEFVDLISIVSESLGKMTGEFTTPITLMQLGLKILNINEEDIFLDYGSGTGSTLLSASKYTSNISGVEINPESYMISRILLDLYDVSSNNIINKNVNDIDISISKANKIFINMPLSMRMPKEQLQNVVESKFKDDLLKNILNARDITWLYPLDVIENTNFEKSVMLINGGPLYSDINLDVRKYLVNNGYIESVIALPSNLLPYTSVPIYMIVFSKGNKEVKFVDATKEFTESTYRNTLDKQNINRILDALNNETSISRVKKLDDLDKEEYTLDPLRYTTPDFPFDDFVNLKDIIISINRGANVSKTDLVTMTSDVPTNYQYLMLNNFHDGILDDELTYLNKLDDTYKQYLIKDNSVIISRISPFKIGTVDLVNKNILANGNLFFLEVDEKVINKDFLTAYLQSRIGIRELNKYVKGNVMKTISIRDLEKIKVPRLSREEQEKIAYDFNLLKSELQAVKKRTLEIQKERLNIFEGGIWCF